MKSFRDLGNLGGSGLQRTTETHPAAIQKMMSFFKVYYHKKSASIDPP